MSILGWTDRECVAAIERLWELGRYVWFSDLATREPLVEQLPC